ncbi:MAG TPA: sensor histidine kinase [Bryobacteraceae bacterium]|jgi:signal transduction histidine kinase
MVPYRGRLSLRIARTVLATACLGWFGLTAGLHVNWLTAVLAAYAVYSLGELPELGYPSATRTAIGLLIDTAYVGLWSSVAPGAWMPALAAGYLLASGVVLLDFARTLVLAAVTLFLAVVLPSPAAPDLMWTVIAGAAVATALAFYKRYLDERMSTTLRHNLIIRSQAEGAREAERQRIAADFHDGPLQSFISFQMRLEIIKKLMGRDPEAGLEELKQLQALCLSQVADLRSFVRSMRPVDEGMSLAASLNRMVEGFQRDTGIVATFAAGEFADPAATEVALEVLQIVRETLNNIQKHAGATRVAVSASRHNNRLDVVVEDNGGGFPFSGVFTLDELELLRQGPVSIKRRARMLNADLVVESRPAQGAKLEIRVPM